MECHLRHSYEVVVIDSCEEFVGQVYPECFDKINRIKVKQRLNVKSGKETERNTSDKWTQAFVSFCLELCLDDFGQ